MCVDTGVLVLVGVTVKDCDSHDVRVTDLDSPAESVNVMLLERVTERLISFVNVAPVVVRDLVRSAVSVLDIVTLSDGETERLFVAVSTEDTETVNVLSAVLLLVELFLVENDCVS